MSADLFAEFGQGPAPTQSTLGRPQTTKQPQPQANPLIDDFDQSDDLFFAGPTNSQSGVNQQFSSSSASGQYVTQAPAVQQQVPSLPAFNLPRQNNSDVLFDATEEIPASDTEDDWGDFEGPDVSNARSYQSQYSTPVAPETKVSKPPPKVQQVTDTFDLLDSLSIEDVTSSANKSPRSFESKPPIETTPIQHGKTTHLGTGGEFTDAPSTKQSAPAPASKATPESVPKAKPKSKSPLKKKATTTRPAPQQPGWDDKAFDDWGDFNDGPLSTPAPAPAPAPTRQKSTPTSPPPASFTSGNTAPSSTVRPTNIPPTIQLLVELMNNLQKEVATTSSKTARQPPTTAQSTSASKIHTITSTAARIIAGRHLRWKRDTILSQSMRIGPARAGKSSGMKLNAVNKHEDVKEEQDAVDVLALWRERAALFNAVVQSAGLRPIPTVAGPAALKVITAKSGQGALKAAHACALCALKRDERVLRVDEEDVQDSFGEWWTDHWGHTGCRLFWEANHGMLGQR
ncbi:hypothetical protein N7481_003941 [Penicillium waksmanii]|uniref:uncharacterized protein n=1 Tax=Penicillium waksmanii TaxID=69791 RepID=UPI002548B514|nr:uncharacterized protein N7481_003941 [Penicillium waksmanii]KAJ5988731.1 hypothetical protein N7481_003941 [Penicillium waksmanii]